MKLKKKPRARVRRLYSYHFDLGNSTTGPVGFCARIHGSTKGEALRRLYDLLPNEHELFKSGSEYICVYFNTEAIGIRDIDDCEQLEPGE